MSPKKNGKTEREYIWKMCREDQFRLWPKSNKISYFSNSKSGRFMPNSLIKTGRDKIAQPEPLEVDPWEKHSITLAGFAEHTRGYYHSRLNENFTDVMIVSHGILCVKYGGVKKRLGRGEALVIPAGNLCDSYVENMNTRVYWVHFKNVPYWDSLFGRDISTRKLECLEQLSSLMNAYYAEVFSPARSVALLELFAEGVISVLRREFKSPAGFSLGSAQIDKIIAQISGNPRDAPSLEQQAAALNVSARTLNVRCEKYFGKNFTKLVAEEKMKTALALVKSGVSNAKIAEKIGFANAYSFSKAFKIFYGASPKIMLAQSALK